jgi:hypothetical protein
MEDRPLQFLANQSAEQLIFIAAPGSSTSVDRWWIRARGVCDRGEHVVPRCAAEWSSAQRLCRGVIDPGKRLASGPLAPATDWYLNGPLDRRRPRGPLPEG